jgi:hypothetical protein
MTQVEPDMVKVYPSVPWAIEVATGTGVVARIVDVAREEVEVRMTRVVLRGAVVAVPPVVEVVVGLVCDVDGDPGYRQDAVSVRVVVEEEVTVPSITTSTTSSASTTVVGRPKNVVVWVFPGRQGAAVAAGERVRVLVSRTIEVVIMARDMMVLTMLTFGMTYSVQS